MRLTRRTKSLALAFMFALGPSFACATGDDEPKATPAPEVDPTPPLDAAVADATDDGLPPMPSTCSAGGFCYVRSPYLGPLLAVSASSVDDAWMVPEQSGALLRWDGASLKQIYEYEGPTPPNITFSGVWAETKDNVWAAAMGSDGHVVLVRYSSPPGGGAPAFRELPTRESATAILGIWGTPAGDTLWMVTDRAVLRVREDESGVIVDNLVPSTDAEDAGQYSWRGVWGFGPGDVYVAGRVCPSDYCEPKDSYGAIGHYDGTSWSVTTIDSASDVLSLRGTPPGTDRRLWFDTSEPSSREGDGSMTTYAEKTYLVPITNAGAPGAPLYSHPADVAPACSNRVGHAAAPTSAWLSSGLLLCRWTGTKLEPVQTSPGALPVVATLNGIWAGGAEDVWIVGAAVTRDGLPPRGFAARRTAATATGGQP
ncbi:MAG: hypothetical protein BGO98_27880 [Myxococcales bacterium 68-20]|nr:hypothetical protein [Myxococcales bacterium]OJY30532.1 MAG: hypothetical protein BGO98_27880 [Myxococcales bacterium 68-20]